MTSQASNPKVSICADKQKLGNALIEAIRDVMDLQDQELASFVNGGDGLERFQLALKQARRKREFAKKRYLLHLRTHGC